MTNAATCAPASTPSTSISTACRRNDAGYVFDTFPIVRRDDETTFGHYRTKALVLAYMNALSVGDTETRVVV